MIPTIKQVKEKILRLLNEDPTTVEDSGGGAITGGSTYPADLINDSIRAALDAVSSRVWKTALWEIDEEGSEFDLPDDLMEVLSVFDVNLGKFIPKLSMNPNNTTLGNSENSWYAIAGVLNLSATFSSDGGKVYYMTSWEFSEDESESLEVPDITLNAIVFYACSYCLLKEGAGISTIRQYNTRIDSGQPTDNATNEMANYFLKRFDIEMARIPLQVREQA